MKKGKKVVKNGRTVCRWVRALGACYDESTKFRKMTPEAAWASAGPSHVYWIGCEAARADKRHSPEGRLAADILMMLQDAPQGDPAYIRLLNHAKNFYAPDVFAAFRRWQRAGR